MFVSTTVVSTRRRWPRITRRLRAIAVRRSRSALSSDGSRRCARQNERLGIGDPFTIDAAKGSIYQAAPHLSLTFVKAPLVEVLQDQHPEDHFGGSAEPAALLAQRIALRERGGDQVDKCFVLERGIDPLQGGIPQFVAVGQQHFEHAALPMGATDHGTSHEVSQPWCVLRGFAVESFFHHDGVTPSRPSTKLRVHTGSGRRALRKHWTAPVTSAPESS